MPHKKNINTVPSEFSELSDLVGLFMEYWGFKKIHGQIWLHIFLSRDPLDATSLVKRLVVSKALVSLAIKDLLHYKVIHIVGQGHRRTILYQSNPDLTKVILSVLMMRERKMLSQIMSSWKNLKKLDPVSTDHIPLNSKAISKLGEMIETAECTLDLLIDSQLALKDTSD